jgi:cell division protein FtsQ
LPELNEDLLRYTLLLVDVLASKESGIESLDFRSGIASYIPKEASSE